MLEQFEGSVAALREIERQYGSLQVMSPSVPQSNSNPCPQKHTCIAHDAPSCWSSIIAWSRTGIIACFPCTSCHVHTGRSYKALQF